MVIELTETYLMILLGIFINGFVTGLAVFLATHTGKRVIDKIKISKTDMKQDDELEELKKFVIGGKR